MRALDIGMGEKSFPSIEADQFKSFSYSSFSYLCRKKTDWMKGLQGFRQILDQGGLAHTWKGCNQKILFYEGLHVSPQSHRGHREIIEWFFSVSSVTLW